MTGFAHANEREGECETAEQVLEEQAEELAGNAIRRKHEDQKAEGGDSRRKPKGREEGPSRETNEWDRGEGRAVLTPR